MDWSCALNRINFGQGRVRVPAKYLSVRSLPSDLTILAVNRSPFVNVTTSACAGSQTTIINRTAGVAGHNRMRFPPLSFSWSFSAPVLLLYEYRNALPVVHQTKGGKQSALECASLLALCCGSLLPSRVSHKYGIVFRGFWVHQWYRIRRSKLRQSQGGSRLSHSSASAIETVPPHNDIEGAPQQDHLVDASLSRGRISDKLAPIKGRTYASESSI